MRSGLVKGLAALCAVALIASCSPSFRNHGLVPRDSELANIVLGQDSKEEVVEKIGAPSTDGLRQENAWYYVESRFRVIGFSAPQEIEREVLRITFAENGTVANIEKFGLEDGRIINLSARETPTSTPDLGFVQALFRNFGRSSPGQLLN